LQRSLPEIGERHIHRELRKVALPSRAGPWSEQALREQLGQAKQGDRNGERQETMREVGACRGTRSKSEADEGLR
jgi:hypothetical protein